MNEVIYSKNELASMSGTILIDLLKRYSIKYIGVKKQSMIEHIVDYQNHITQLKSQLFTDNPLKQYHRGVVSYSLPKLIIDRIIMELWKKRYKHTGLKENYQYLLSLALISKQIFELISTHLFHVLRVTNKQLLQTNSSLKQKQLNPYSVMKNITNLTVSGYILRKELFHGTPIELDLMFGNIKKLTIFRSYSRVTVPVYERIAKHFQKLEKLTLVSTIIHVEKIFRVLGNIETLRYLDISQSSFRLIMSNQLLSHLHRLHTLVYSNMSVRLSVHKPSTSPSLLELEETDDAFSYNEFHTIHLHNLLTTIMFDIYDQYQDFINKDSNISKFLCNSDQCQIKKIGFRVLKVAPDFTEWLTYLLSNNNTISTIKFDVRNNHTDTLNIIFKMVIPHTNIKRVIVQSHDILKYHNKNQQNNNAPTSFYLAKSKLENSNIRTHQFYFKRIIDCNEPDQSLVLRYNQS